MASISGGLAEAYVMRKLYAEKLKKMEAEDSSKGERSIKGKQSHGIFRLGKKVHPAGFLSESAGKPPREDNSDGAMK
ncbi:hypothetical protein AMTRI_Chr04g189030 [Amborella trichopoda]|uniref:Uncharacterized protein n=1 Tax=Amborella trichopoda TaxID=13333 RepID=W1NGI6_AMBTC|nr:hypothetical protein AMTR_s00010p00222330 [Amborella trichopoda]